MIAPEDRQRTGDADAIIQRLEHSLKMQDGPIRKDVKTGLISDLFDRQILAQLERVFASSTSGHFSLTASEFRETISQYIPLSLVENVYRAIDVNDLGHVKYADFTNYLIASEAGSSFSARSFIAKLSQLFAQEEDPAVIHKDTVDCLVFAKRPCPMLISGGRDGALNLWHPETLERIAEIDHKDKNSIYHAELERSMDTYTKAQSAKRAAINNKPPTKMAITAMTCMLNWGLLCVGSADCCVTVYELANQEVCGRITDLAQLPTALCCFQISHPIMVEGSDGITHQLGEETTSFLSIGDSRGHVHIVKLHPEFGASAEVGSKKKNQVLFAQSVQNNFAHKVVHSDWINRQMFIPEVSALLSASVDGTISLLDVDRMQIHKVFKGHGAVTAVGVKALDWSAFGKYVLSAADRTLLLWDPYTLEIMSKIDNLRSPIVHVQVVDSVQKIFGGLMNKSIYVWQFITLELLQVVVDSTLYKPQDSLGAMIFVPDRSMLYTAGDRVSVWSLERTPENAGESEEEDLVAVLYNALFNQVLIVKSLGTLKIYQTETGEIFQQFCVLPIDPRTNRAIPVQQDPITGIRLPVIVNAALDKNLSRLITTCADLSVHFWNTHDGSHLLTFYPQLYSSSLAHMYSSASTHILALSHEILFQPPPTHAHALSQTQPHSQAPASQKVLLLGTDLGHVCVYCERQGTVEETPMAFLRLTDKHPHVHSQLYPTQPPFTNQTHNRHRRLSQSSMRSSSPPPSVTITQPSVPQSPAHSRALRTPLIAENAPNTPHTPHSASTQDAVLWTCLLPASSPSLTLPTQPQSAHTAHNDATQSPLHQWLYVGHASGRVSVWNCENNQRVCELATHRTGVSLYAMRLQRHATSHTTHTHSFPSHMSHTQSSITQASHRGKKKSVSVPSSLQKEKDQQSLTEKEGAEQEDIEESSMQHTHSQSAVQNLRARTHSEPERELAALAQQVNAHAERARERREREREEAQSRLTVAQHTAHSHTQSQSQSHRETGLKGERDAKEPQAQNDTESHSQIQVPAHTLTQEELKKRRDTQRESMRQSIVKDSARLALQREGALTLMAQRRERTRARDSLSLSPSRKPTTHAAATQPLTQHSHTSSVNLSQNMNNSTISNEGSVVITEAIQSQSRRDTQRESLARRWSVSLRNPLISGTSLGVSQSHIVQPHMRSHTREPTHLHTLAQSLDNSISTLSLPRVDSSLSVSSQDTHHTSSAHNAHSRSGRSQSHRHSLSRQRSRSASLSRSQSFAKPSHPQSASSQRSERSPLSVRENEESTVRTADGESVSTERPPQQVVPRKVVVDCVVALREARVLIGACSDYTLRMWDLDTCEVMCSTPYIPTHTDMPFSHATPRPLTPEEDSSLRHLCVSDCEDALCGGYDSGTVRVWSIHTYSISTLRQLLHKHLQSMALTQQGSLRNKSSSSHNAATQEEFGVRMTLAISPLTLIAEWQAHNCPIIALEYVWFDYELSSPTQPHTPATPAEGRAKRTRAGDLGGDLLEGYVLSAGLDQRVSLWSLRSGSGGSGACVTACVGDLGTFGWDINDERTWLSRAAYARHKAPRNAQTQAQRQRHRRGDKSAEVSVNVNAMSALPQSARKSEINANETSTRLSLAPDRSPSSEYLLHFWKQKKDLSAKDMHRYVDELSRHITRRAPLYQEVDGQLRKVMHSHPVVPAHSLSPRQLQAQTVNKKRGAVVTAATAVQ